MDPDTQAVLVKAVWLAIGLILGYAFGVVRTVRNSQEKMAKELHECHMALCHKEGSDSAEDQ